jgi:hypothetical protein
MDTPTTKHPNDEPARMKAHPITNWGPVPNDKNQCHDTDGTRDKKNIPVGGPYKHLIVVLWVLTQLLIMIDPFTSNPKQQLNAVWSSKQMNKDEQKGVSSTQRQAAIGGQR